MPAEVAAVRVRIGERNYIQSISRDITERKRQMERTAALLDLTTLAETLDEKTLLQRGLDTVQHLTGSRIGFLHFVSEDQNEIELVTWSSDTLAHYCQANFDRHYPVSDAGIWADCIRLKQAIIINDYAAAPGKKGFPEGHANVQRFISVPIFEGEQVRMIVGVGNAARDYDEHDVETVKLFSYDLYRIAQRRRAGQALNESENRYRQLFESMSSGVAIYQPDEAGEVFTVKSVNRAVERIEQVRREEVLGRSVEAIFPGVRAFGLLAVFQRVCRSGEAEHFPPAFYQDERIAGWRDNYVYRLDSGEIVAVYDDVTERKTTEMALTRANRALLTLSMGNEALVRATSEEELLQNVTRVIVAQGGYRMARVSYADDNPEKSLRRVASAGAGEDLCAGQLLTWADTDKGQVPVAHAIRSGTPQVCRDIASDPRFAPWKDVALAHGFASNIGLPLSDGRRTFGGLSIYSAEKDAFDGDEARFLIELSNDLAYGIVTLRTRLDLARADQELRALNAELEQRVAARTADLVQTNQALRLHWEVARNMAEAVYLIRASDGVIVETNPKFDAMFGYAPGELLGQPTSMVNAPAKNDPAATAREIMAALNETGEWHGEVENIRKDGSRFWCSANVSAFEHPKFGEVWISVHNDITQRKAAERMKNEIISTVSHELRTPLSSLRGFAELMLAREFPPQKQREFLTIIDQESRRLGRLIDDFLDIQRIESGRQRYDMEILALLPLLQDAVALFSKVNERHRFRVEAGPALPAVHGDREKLTQVLENLLSNAVKFSPAGGDISVAARVRDGEVEVRVTDHGIGIPPEALPRLFQKFYRVEQPKALRQPGTGLGLALVKEIVQAHGGRVWAESEPGQGSTFYFTLSISPPIAGAASVTPARGPIKQ